MRPVETGGFKGDAGVRKSPVSDVDDGCMSGVTVLAEMDACECPTHQRTPESLLELLWSIQARQLIAIVTT